MKVLGYDVGIKNLAYCVTEYDHETEHFNVIQPCKKYWNIINLTEDQEKHCESPNCEANVTQWATVSGVPRYYCGKHKKVHKLFLEENEIDIMMTDDVTAKCEHSASCKSKSKFMTQEKYLCTTHKNMFEKNETKNRTLKKHKLFVKDFSIHDLKIKLIREFDKLIDIFLSVDCVCIELQPVFKNPSMKALSDVMWSWFALRGIVDGEVNNSTINKLCFFAASNKMKINGQEEELNEEIDNAKNKYKKTKDLGVQQCIKMLSHDQTCIDHLNTFKKKDDLADACLHSCYYIQKEMGLKKNKKKTKKAVTQDTDTLENTINA